MRSNIVFFSVLLFFILILKIIFLSLLPNYIISISMMENENLSKNRKAPGYYSDINHILEDNIYLCEF